MSFVYDVAGRLDLMRQAATAQEEVCQLLQAALKQQQPGQQTVQTPQQHLQMLAHAMLGFWTAIDGIWPAGQADKTPALAMQQPALELAALLTQTLPADSSMYTTLAKLTLRCVECAWCWCGMLHGPYDVLMYAKGMPLSAPPTPQFRALWHAAACSITVTISSQEEC
jgi:hypothetical protein